MTASPLEDPARLLADLDFVRGLARSLCADPHAAEDLAQETLTTAVEKGPDDVRSRRGWLAAVARNLAHNRRRGERRRREREQRACAGSPQSVPSAAEVAAREQLRRTVVDAVMELPATFRDVVLLRYYRGCDTRECAIRLGIPESTVRTRLRRALERLRARLDRDHDGDRRAWVAALQPLALPDDGAVGPGAAVSSSAVGGKKLAAAALLAALPLVGVLALRELTGHAAAPPSPSAATTDAATDAAASGTESTRVTPAERSRAVTGPTGTAGGPESWRLLGTVRSSEGKLPIAGAHLRAWAAPDRPDLAMHGVAIDEAESDALGRFAISLARLQAMTPMARSGLRVFVSADAAGHDVEISDHHLRDELAADGTLTVAIELARDRLTKGRVVTSDGRPVHDAVVAAFLAGNVDNTTSAIDGSFTLPAPEPEDAGRELCVIASHPAFGFSRPVRLFAPAGGELRTGDLVLDQPLGVVRGRVHFPTGEPVALAAVSLHHVDDDDSPVDLLGFRIDAFDSAFLRGSTVHHEVRADEDGRFAIRNARPGRHEIDTVGGSSAQVVVSDRHPVDVDLEVAIDDLVDDRTARVSVRIEDRDGRWLPDAVFGIHRWHGQRARAARLAYEAQGVTNELLATSDRYDTMFAGSDRVVPATPGSFLLFEVSCSTAGPVFESCVLGPDQHHGSVRVVLEERRATGSLQIDARDPDGSPLAPLLLKVSRVPGQAAVPVFLPGLETGFHPPSHIAPPWHVVPANGRVDGLPPGDLHVELLPASIVDGRWQPPSYPVAEHSVTIEPGATTSLSSTYRPGTELRVEVRLPRAAAGERIELRFDRIAIASLPDGRTLHRRLRAADGGAGITGENGICDVACQEALLPGRYRLRMAPPFRRERLFRAPGDEHGRWMPLGGDDTPIELEIDLQPDSAPPVFDFSNR